MLTLCPLHVPCHLHSDKRVLFTSASCFHTSNVPYCTVLSCTVLCCTIVYCTALKFIALYCTTFHCTVLYHTVLYCTALCRTLFSVEQYYTVHFGSEDSMTAVSQFSHPPTLCLVSGVVGTLCHHAMTSNTALPPHCAEPGV